LTTPDAGSDVFRPVVSEEDRLAAVRRYEILDTPADGTFDQVAAIAAAVFDTPIATVSIVDTDRVWLAATHGLGAVTEVGVEPGLCVSAVQYDGPYIVNDAAVDPRTLHHPLVRGELGLRFYVAAPITTSDGYRLGTVNAIGREPREVTDTQVTVLTHLAALVADHLELRLSTLRTVRAERQLRAEADQRAEAQAQLFNQMREAAVTHREASPAGNCQLGGSQVCDRPAELKVADSWGDSAWGCVRHVEEVVVNVPSVFIADESLGGLDAYRQR